MSHEAQHVIAWWLGKYRLFSPAGRLLLPCHGAEVQDKSALGVLRRLPSSFQAIFLAFFDSSVSSKQTVFT